MTAPPGPDLMAERVTDPYAPETVQRDADSSLATDALMERLLDQVRASMHVDTAAILLFDESRQFLVATAARGIEEEVRHGARVRVGLGFAGRIAIEKRPIVLAEVTPLNVVNPLLLRRGIASMVGVPIFEGERVLGVMHAGSLTSRRFTPIDVAMLQRAAGRASQVIVRHRAFVDRAGAAALVQSLTPRLPQLPGLDLAARYVPGSAHGVGGDWYDVFRLPSGLVGVAIGDVMGHGLDAAHGDGPHGAVRCAPTRSKKASPVVGAQPNWTARFCHFEPGHLATVLLRGRYAEPVTGNPAVASAGHLPPILVRAPGGSGRAVAMDVDVPIGVPVPRTPAPDRAASRAGCAARASTPTGSSSGVPRTSTSRSSCCCDTLVGRLRQLGGGSLRRDHGGDAEGPRARGRRLAAGRLAPRRR